MVEEVCTKFLGSFLKNLVKRLHLKIDSGDIQRRIFAHTNLFLRLYADLISYFIKLIRFN